MLRLLANENFPGAAVGELRRRGHDVLWARTHLEGSLWMSVHTQLCAEIARRLAPLVRPRYLALTTERFVLEEPESVAVATSSIDPDVGMISTPHGNEGGRPEAAIAAPLRLATILPAAIPHVTVEIRDAASRQLVTAIEVLSPSNKHGDGRKEYLSKRRGLLVSSAHVLEIDYPALRPVTGESRNRKQ